LVCAALAASSLPALLAGCKTRPAAGKACQTADRLVCASASAALICDATAWVEVPCRGPRGCTRGSDADECDDTIAGAADRCPRNPPLDYACTADRAQALVCKDGTFGLWRDCRGPEGCQVVDGRNVHCDTSLGQPGDPCAQHGTYACSVDKKTMLACDGTTLLPASSCRGPEGCHTQRESRKVDCDDSIALEGDPCDQPKRIACSVDHKEELVCVSNKYVKKRECRRSDCRLEGNELFCD
jgi:hypothetical protein